MEMTWADTLEAKGMEKGLEKGRVEGMRTLVADLLERKFGPRPEETKRHLGAIASAEELTGIFERALDAESLGEVAGL